MTFRIHYSYQGAVYALSFLAKIFESLLQSAGQRFSSPASARLSFDLSVVVISVPVLHFF